MKNSLNTVLRESLGLAMICLLLGGHIWAQAQVASQSATPPLVSADVASVSNTVTLSATKPHDDGFVIGNGDVLAVSVWKQPDLSRSIPVRSDGKISLPLVGEVQATGQTPLKLEDELTRKLQPYLNEPEVTVIVEQINSQKFNILGRVAKPGSYPLVNPTTVLDAIALAGGCRDFAKQKSIYVLRHLPNGTETRMPFNYQDVIKGKNTAQNIELQPHDTVVVP
jgi:polysaccharide export outer membrane protein